MVYWPNFTTLPRVISAPALGPPSRVLWQTKLLKWPYSLTVEGDLIVSRRGDDEVCIFDRHTGQESWIFHQEPAITSGIAVANDTAYFGCEDGSLVALDLERKATKWVFKADKRVVATPVIAGDTLYFGSRDKCLYALDVATGQEKWVFTTKGEIRGPAAVGPDDVVYIGSFDNRLYAVYPDTGQMKWHVHTNPDVIFSAPSVADGTVYFGCNDSNLYAVDAANGAIKWKFKANSWLRTFPVASEGSVYFGAYRGYQVNNYLYNYLYALNAETGEPRWIFPTGDIQTGPFVTKRRVYITTVDGTMYSISTRTGRRVWRYGSSSRGIYNPTFAGGIIYATTEYTTASGDYTIYLCALKPGRPYLFR